MDVLSEVLSWLRVEGTVTRRSEFRSPWGIAYDPTTHFSFISVEQGSCFITFTGQQGLVLEAGDLVMVSPGQVASLADEPDTPKVPYAEVLAACSPPKQDGDFDDRSAYPPIEYGGTGRRTVIRGWGLRIDSSERHPLLSLLPPYIRITDDERRSQPWLETTLRFIRHETHEPGDGVDMMTIRLVDLLFVQVIRSWFRAQPEGQGGWVGALRDPAIGRALKLMHRHCAKAWTVEELGRAVGMSRSTFSARFLSLVGSSPLKYLTQLRMHLAANAFKANAGASVAEVARKVGYDTESSFGRAFKRYFQVSPAAFRRKHQSGE